MKKIAFIADYFIEDGIGGAELTTDAVIRYGTSKGFEISPVKCSDLTVEILQLNNNEYHFIVCNFTQLNNDVKIYMIKNCSYSIIEYDYKICQYRSFELHQQIEGTPCDCHLRASGKINSAFFGYAKKVWFMSEKQKNMILDKISVLKNENCEVLNSVFAYGDLNFMYSIKDNEKDNKYLILDSQSPVKPSDKCIEYANVNNLEYELISNLLYHELLIKLSVSKGLIFMPVASDTCPRLVMEAKMLGCDLVLNDHVQHKDEEWFKTQESCFEHLDNRGDVFWNYYEQR